MRAMHRNVITFISIVIISYAAHGQATMSINGFQFTETDSGWYKNYNNVQYLVDDSLFVVQWKSTTDDSSRIAFNNSQQASVVKSLLSTYTILKITNTTNILENIETYLNSGLVDAAEPTTYLQLPDSIGSDTSTTTLYPASNGIPLPNDTHFPLIWALNNSADNDINAPEAWQISRGDSSIIVAVLDGGIRWDHEDLGYGQDNYKNIWYNNAEIPNDSVDNDNNGYKDDYIGWNFSTQLPNNDPTFTSGHGTVLAGIISAKSNNSVGISGVAGGWNSPGVRLMNLRISDGLTPGIWSVTIPEAIEYAVDNGARIVAIACNPDSGDVFDAAIGYAYNNGCLIVAASGNQLIQPWYPSTHPMVLSVSGIMKNGDFLKYWDSGIWKSAPHGPSIDIAAPAEDAVSTIKTTASSYETGTNHQTGTSQSCPLVAGIAALMLSVKPSLMPGEIMEILKSTATDIGTTGKDDYFGWGRANAYKALQSVITPINLSPTNGSTSSILYWSNSSQWIPTSYRVQIATDTNFSNLVKNVSISNGTSFIPESLSSSIGYYWRVRAEKQSVTSLWTIGCYFFVPPAPPPPTLTATTARVLYNGAMLSCPKLIWTTTTGVTYQLYKYICNFGSCTDTVGNIIYSGPNAYYIDNSWISGEGTDKTVYYYVKATANYQSSFSNKVSYGWGEYFDPEKRGDITRESIKPTEFILHGNYPDPFNPYTQIKYYVPSQQSVKISIYDILGREIVILHDGIDVEGEQHVTFDASNLSSGIYLCRVQVVHSTIVKKMLLTK